MKKLLLILVFTLLFRFADACSCYEWYSFCATTTELENDLILCGKIIQSDSLFIRLQVIDIFKGEDERDTITIWNGTDFDCNGLVSMRANGLGLLNDTIIVVLPRITLETLENSWDVIDDYRTPLPLCFNPVLQVKGDTIIGDINNSGNTQPDWHFTKIEYNNFKNLWSNGQIDCSTLIGVNEYLVLPEFKIEKQNDVLYISTGSVEKYKIQIFDLLGNQLFTTEFISNVTISTINFNNSILVLKFEDCKGLSQSRKLLIN